MSDPDRNGDNQDEHGQGINEDATHASDTRIYLLVVATLIAAVTFEAGANPPGGVWQEDSIFNLRAGKSILAQRHEFVYMLFIFCNTVAFTASVNLITTLMIDLFNALEVKLAIYAMFVTYIVSIVAVEPPKVAGVVIFAVMVQTRLRAALKWYRSRAGN